jgi:hypothetical protein
MTCWCEEWIQSQPIPAKIITCPGKCPCGRRCAPMACGDRGPTSAASGVPRSLRPSVSAACLNISVIACVSCASATGTAVMTGIQWRQRPR